MKGNTNKALKSQISDLNSPASQINILSDWAPHNALSYIVV
ncbi:hypothetical protein K2D_25660 [Enterococcus hirae]|nr:hypothetical protein [Enterococcus hirae]UBL09842.1 hypothetical protein [Enterococcus faecium]UBL10216.1 hypothetical protein [Enterococcus faecium]UZP83065.1 hypothetical protein [Enterococcus faecium]UZP83121.1 hypothetical protein [Enterococcus hirae]